MLDIWYMVIGLLFLMKSADFLVEGSSALAKRFWISDIIIGLTIVAFGTSMPEFFTSIFAAFWGSSDIAIGNVLGSNIGNILLILWLSALVYPVIAQKYTQNIEIPYSLFLAWLLFFLSFDSIISPVSQNILSLVDGIILLVTFALFVWYTFYLAKTHTIEVPHDLKIMNIAKSSLFIFWWIAGLWLWAYLLVNGATNLALHFWVPQAFIGLTIVAIGTSLPELFTSVVAAYKKNSDIAIGNIVGSNIFNISFILWMTAFIKPISVDPSFQFDFIVLSLTTILFFMLLIISGKKRRIGRMGGIIFILGYLSYISYLIFTQVM